MLTNHAICSQHYVMHVDFSLFKEEISALMIRLAVANAETASQLTKN